MCDTSVDMADNILQLDKDLFAKLNEWFFSDNPVKQLIDRLCQLVLMITIWPIQRTQQPVLIFSLLKNANASAQICVTINLFHNFFVLWNDTL